MKFNEFRKQMENFQYEVQVMAKGETFTSGDFTFTAPTDGVLRVGVPGDQGIDPLTGQRFAQFTSI